MTSHEKLEKANREQFNAAKSEVQTKLVLARRQGLFEVSDAHFQLIVTLASGAVEAAYVKSQSSFMRTVQELLK